MVENARFSVTNKYGPIAELMKKTEPKVLAIWAVDCIQRILYHYVEKYPEDYRPQEAIERLKKWIKSPGLTVADMRKAAISCHAAARRAVRYSAARSAARAAGHAAAIAHVPTHSIFAANYSLQAIYRVATPSNAERAVVVEREWQYRHLIELKNKAQTR